MDSKKIQLAGIQEFAAPHATRSGCAGSRGDLQSLRNAHWLSAHRTHTMKNYPWRFPVIILGLALIFALVPPVMSAPPNPSAKSAAGISRPSSSPAETAKLSFRRVFKSSSPEFIEIVVPEDGRPATYEIRQLDEDPGASPFELSASLRARMFDLADKLHRFQGQDLDVHRKIANLGEKTFTWEKGKEVHEVRFNYTLNTAATQLLQIFEGLARQQEHVVLLTRRMRYDRLGINDALLQFETDLNHKLLPEPQAALPMLDEIGNDSRFVDIARQRARTLAERIRHQS